MSAFTKCLIAIACVFQTIKKFTVKPYKTFPATLNKALHTINSELSISLYHELLETFKNISRAACVLLWQQHKVQGSIYFTRDKVVDFSKSGHIC